MLLWTINLSHLNCACFLTQFSRIAPCMKTFQPHCSPLISTWPWAVLENVNQLCCRPAPDPPMASYHFWSKNLTFSPGCAQPCVRRLHPLLAPLALVTLASPFFHKTHYLLELWHLKFSLRSSSSPLLRRHSAGEIPWLAYGFSPSIYSALFYFIFHFLLQWLLPDT